MITAAVVGREPGDDDLVLAQARRDHEQWLREWRGHERWYLLNGGLAKPFRDPRSRAPRKAIGARRICIVNG